MCDEILQSIRDLRTHVEEQGKELYEINQRYEQSKIEREQKAAKFIEGKNVEQLKCYLATQPVPYNDWKDATSEQLATLAVNVFDD